LTTPRRTKIALPDVAVVAPQGLEAVAKRIDGVLDHLTDQLSNFEAADSTTLGGVPATSVISGANSMYFQTFEDDVSEDWNFHNGSAASVSFTNNGRAGGRAFRNTSVALTIADNTNIPFDPSRLYRMRTRIREVSGTGMVRIGLMGVGADGTTLVNRDGDDLYTSQNEVCAEDATLGSAWEVFEGYIKGVASSGTGTTPSTDPSAPRVLHDDTRYIRPFIENPATGVFECDYITLEILTETTEANVLLTEAGGRSVSTIASTVKSDGDIATDKVIEDSLKDDAVTGGKVASGTLSADNMGTLSGGDLAIDFTATGTDPVLNHTAFSLNADGSADFSGTVSAESFTGDALTIDGVISLKALGDGPLLVIGTDSVDGGIELGHNYVGTAAQSYLFENTAGVLTVTKSSGTDPGAFSLDVPEIGFYGTTPIALQTGVAVTEAGIHAALVALGLITA